MRGKSSKGYERPNVTEYGSVESITQNDKIGPDDDVATESAPITITGSII